jgi:hypothetical protein
VKDTTIDDARLAALLDGRLDAAEREELLARLSESDEDYLIFADAAAIVREREGIVEIPAPEFGEEEETAPQRIAVPDIAPATERGAEADAIPIRTRFTAGPAEPAAAAAEHPSDADVIPLRPRRRFPLVAWGAIAAVLVAVALIPVLRSRAGDPYDPARLAAGMTAPRDSFWTAAAFFVTRGGETPNIEEQRGAARLGSLLVDMELAVRAGDTAATHDAARSAGNAVAGMNGAGFLDQSFKDVVNHLGESPEKMLPRVDEARQATKETVDADYFAAGAWSEAARLAAKANDAEFFRSDASRKAIDRILALRPLSETARPEAEAVKGALSADGTPDWATLYDHLGRLVKALGA